MYSSQTTALSILIWCIVFETIYHRICNRLWDQIHLLVILKEKARQCKLATETIVCSHFCPIALEDIVSSSYLATSLSLPKSSHDPLVVKHEDYSQNKSSHSPPVCEIYPLPSSSLPPPPRLFTSLFSESSTHKKLLEEREALYKAIEMGLIFDDKESRKDNNNISIDTDTSVPLSFIPSHTDLSKLGGLTNKYCALIAINICETDTTNIFMDFDNYALYDVVSEIAHKHKVAYIRNFGNTWIGSYGFFGSSGSKMDKQNSPGIICSAAMMMASEVSAVMEKMRRKVTIAIDANTILGGFVKGSIAMFGPEIRWVCRMAQESLMYSNMLLISSDVKKILSCTAEGRTFCKALIFSKLRLSALSSNHNSLYQAEDAFAVTKFNLLVSVPCDEEILVYQNIYKESQNVNPLDSYQTVLRDVKLLRQNTPAFSNENIFSYDENQKNVPTTTQNDENYFENNHSNKTNTMSDTTDFHIFFPTHNLEYKVCPSFSSNIISHNYINCLLI